MGTSTQGKIGERTRPIPPGAVTQVCTTKTCMHDGAEQPLSNFHNRPNGSKHRQCKDCASARDMAIRDAKRTTPKRETMTNRQKAELRDLIYAKTEAFKPANLRQIFYGLVSDGVLKKTDKAYRRLMRQLVDMRREDVIPYDWVEDLTRSVNEPMTHGSLEEALRFTADTYARNPWVEQDERVEIWLEKRALTSLFTDITYDYSVPLMVTGGYSSFTFLQRAAETIKASGKHTHVYQFGDNDPAGRNRTQKATGPRKPNAPSAR